MANALSLARDTNIFPWLAVPKDNMTGLFVTTINQVWHEMNSLILAAEAPHLNFHNLKNHLATLHVLVTSETSISVRTTELLDSL
jgi:hypothetical protein